MDAEGNAYMWGQRMRQPVTQVTEVAHVPEQARALKSPAAAGKRGAAHGRLLYGTSAVTPSSRLPAALMRQRTANTWVLYIGYIYTLIIWLMAVRGLQE